MKEFMEKTGLEYEEINPQAQPEGALRLEALGLKLPVVVVGDRSVPGLDLEGIAELVGVDYTRPEILPADVLASQYAIIIAAVARFIGQLPESALGDRFEDRDRTIRRLAAHAGSIMQAFLEAYQSGYYDNGWPTPSPLSETGTRAELVAAAREMGTAFATWWETFGFDEDFTNVIETSWGSRTMHEALERAVWHTAQHTRQLMHFLESRGITPDGPLTEADLAGLPLPDRVQA
jgi:hypothetical protein